MYVVMGCALLSNEAESRSLATFAELEDAFAYAEVRVRFLGTIWIARDGEVVADRDEIRKRNVARFPYA
jgi:hypothetical protein